MDYFRQALQREPGFALAHVGLADCYNVLPYFSRTTQREAFPQAKAAVLRALELDESLAEAHASLALLRFGWDLDIRGAESEYKRAIELNPNYATAHHWYGLYLSILGRFDEGLREIETARQLDPLSLIIKVDQAALLTAAGRLREAEANLLALIEVEPNFAMSHYYLGQAYRFQGRFAEAIAEFEKEQRLAGSTPKTLTCIALANLGNGNRKSAEQTLKSLKNRAVDDLPAYWVASLYAGLDDNDQAIAWLQLAEKQRAGELIALLTDRTFEGLRSDERFIRLLQRLGFS
jgi:tetratricopeptide (TPR) repeat protein